MWVLTAALRTAPPCLYSNRDKPVLWCYQLAIYRPTTFINTASFHTMCSSDADTRQYLWFICCTVKHTTVGILYHSTALWRNVWSYTSSAKHAYGTNRHMQFIRPILNSLYGTVNIVCAKISCIFLLPFIYNTAIHFHFTFRNFGTSTVYFCLLTYKVLNDGEQNGTDF